MKHTYWRSRLTTAKGKRLYKAGMEMKCEFHSTGKPTYCPADTNKIPDVIDYFVVNGVSANYTHVEESYDLASDHSPIIVTLWNTVVNRQVPPFLRNRKTDWEGFREALENSIIIQVPLKSPYQLEEEVDSFTTILQKAAWNNTQ